MMRAHAQIGAAAALRCALAVALLAVLASADIPPSQADALTAMKASMTSPFGWARNWPSVVNGSTACALEGVRCAATSSLGGYNETVTGIDLNTDRLIGIIPYEIGNLTDLKEMDLSKNYIQGTLPSTIGQLTKLKRLILFGNRIGGLIPPSLFHPTIEDMQLNGNIFTGNITDDVSNAKNLTYIDLSTNQLQGGTQLSLFSSLPKIQHVDLSLNNLVENISEINVQSSSSLQFLKLNDNHLFGCFPPTLSALSALEYLIVDANRISCEIPSFIFNMTTLRYFQASQNQLYGGISPLVGNLVNLEGIKVYGNRLNGSIPNDIGNLVKLQYVDLSGNDFSGEFPPEIAHLRALKMLRLSANPISGVIPDAIGNLTELESIELDDTNISGYEVPTGLHYLKKLKLLNIERANVSWGFVETVLALYDLTSITVAKLGYNPIRNSGRTVAGVAFCEENIVPPKCNLTNLVSISMAQANLGGFLVEGLGRIAELHALREADLHNNDFVGSIPSLFRFIPIMNLANNTNMRGPMPEFLVRDDANTAQYPEGHYQCAGVKGAPGTTLQYRWTIAPEYFDFDLCTCFEGYYGAKSKCYPCLPGAFSCKEGIMTMSKGTWASPSSTNPTAVLSCPNANACLETFYQNATHHSSSETCATGYTGRLCSRCVTGFTSSSGLQCQKCTNANFSLGVSMAVLVVAILSPAIVLVVERFLRKKLRSKKANEDVSHQEVEMAALDRPDQTFLAADRVGTHGDSRSSSPLTSANSSPQHSPSGEKSSLTPERVLRMRARFQAHIVEVCVVILLVSGASRWWVALALVFVLSVAVIGAEVDSASIASIAVLFVQSAGVLYGEQLSSTILEVPSSILRVTTFGMDCEDSSEQAFVRQRIIVLLSPLLVCGFGSLLFVIGGFLRHISMRRRYKPFLRAFFCVSGREKVVHDPRSGISFVASGHLSLADWFRQCMSVTIFLLLILYLPVSQLALASFECDYDRGLGKSFSTAIPWLECNESGHYGQIRDAAIVATLFLTVGFPVLLAAIVFRFSHGATGLDKKVHEWAGIAFHDFRPSMEVFAVIVLLRRSALGVALGVFQSDTATTSFLICATLTVSVCLQIAFKPYRNTDLNFGETVGLLTLLLAYIWCFLRPHSVHAIIGFTFFGLAAMFVRPVGRKVKEWLR